MKKVFTFAVTVEDDNSDAVCECTNNGFTCMELIGFLELKKQDIMAQVRNPDMFVRKYINEDGSCVAVTEKKDTPAKDYTPVCPRGYTDCVYDPAYIKFSSPEWYKELYGDIPFSVDDPVLKTE